MLARKKLTIFVLVVLVVGFIVVRVRSKGKEGEEIAEVARGTVREELILSGEIKADEHAQLTFQTSGKISWVGVAEGDWVKKGQSLTRVDSTNLSQDKKIADADLRRYASSLDTVYDDLKDVGTESFSEIESRTLAETNKDKAVFVNIKAQQNLVNATLKAPFDGVVSYLAHPFTGAFVIYTEKQVELVNPETVYFEVSADQTEVIDLYIGQKVTMIFDSFIDNELEGEIIFISYTPMSGEVGSVYKVKVGFPADSIDLKKVRIGMTGDAMFILSEKKDVLYVPPEFVNSETKGKYLRLGKNNNKVYVDVGLEGEERVEVSGDIKEGDTVFD